MCQSPKFKITNMINNNLKSLIITVSFVLCLFFQLSAQEKIALSSPDKLINISFFLQKLDVYNYGGNSPDGPFYEVSYKGNPIILPSRLGLVIGGSPELSCSFKILSHEIKHHEATWKPVYGERNSYPDNYNELTIQLQEYIKPGRILNIRFRAYNEGVALSYDFTSVKAKEILNVTEEITEFRFPENTEVWTEYNQQSQGT